MIKVQNIFYMLAYAFQVLNERGFKEFSAEKFDNIHNLLAAILSRGIANQVKKGLHKEYIFQQELMSTPHGKINISQTINQNIGMKKLVCSYDELSENTYVNQILKSTSLMLIGSDDVDTAIKKSLKKSMVFFYNVDVLAISCIKWDAIRYDRNNASYRMLINICYLIIKGLIISEQEKKVKFHDIFDEPKMHRLYEKFILEYYRRHYPFLKPSASYISWNEDNSYIEFLPAMKSDVTLKYNGYTLIIDAKFYGKSMQTGMYGKKTVRSENLYQIYTYVKNHDYDKSGKVSGMLLYAKTEEEFTPDYHYSFDGNAISVKTLDLNDKFNNIAGQLDEIVCSWQKELTGLKIY